jgi:hypothetical protein
MNTYLSHAWERTILQATDTLVLAPRFLAWLCRTYAETIEEDRHRFGADLPMDSKQGWVSTVGGGWGLETCNRGNPRRPHLSVRAHNARHCFRPGVLL